MAGLGAGLAVAVAVAAVAAQLSAVRATAEVTTRAAARTLSEYTGRAVDSADLLAQRVADRVAEQGLGAVTAARVGRQRLAAMMAAAPMVANVYLLDAAGRLVLDAKGFYPAGSTFADRDWFKVLAADSTLAVLVGQAGFDDAARTFAFPVVRRLVDGERRPIGFVVVLVDMEHFKRFFQGLEPAPALALGIYRADGALSVRQPLKPEDLGRSFAGSDLFAHLQAAPEGTFRGRSPYDTLPRVLSYAMVPGRPLVAWVGLSEQPALEAVRLHGIGIAAAALAVVAAMVGLAAACWRALSREHRASAELAGLNRDLERSNADLEQFAYIASHDLKEPLRNIASYVQLLQRRYQGRLDPDADAFIGYTVDGVRRMQAIISELLAYSRIGTGQLTVTPVQAGILVSTALAHLKSVIAEAQAVVEVKGPLPVVAADSAQLGSLFQNLIANALKYRRDDVRPEVEVGCENRGDHWEFYVADNGIGIDAQYHRQIFDLFKRLHPRDRYPGTGIGLAICQRVVERHGGRIWVDSQAGKGSTFRFTLPKVKGA